MLFKDIIISIAIFIASSNALVVPNQLVRRQDGGATSIEAEAPAAEAPAVDASAVDASAAETPAGEAVSDEGITTIEIPGDAAASNASEAPKRDSHISLTNGVLNGGKFAFAGVTGIDNQDKE